ncbi:hypothetical protein SAMN05421874_11584 [Nonomuraea maritima]|uniref:Short chain dehydrogenase n=1 Tax=Nonomuraea maritima TaxID=683260 RepID=A0A1G9H4A2_9ACTN|nr:hypothetical protein [Nonomuraea maritima]SDL07699.1 hypothetical protein SAMN05421874_11584 [Nonomuraea maritima]
MVALTSLAQRYARFDLDNLNAERGYAPMFTYAVAKRAVLYFALELQRRADAAGLRLRTGDPALGDTVTARLLWEASERLTGVSYESALPSA